MWRQLLSPEINHTLCLSLFLCCLIWFVIHFFKNQNARAKRLLVFPHPSVLLPLPFFTHGGEKAQIGQATLDLLTQCFSNSTMPPLVQFAQKIVGKKEVKLETWVMLLVCSSPGSHFCTCRVRGEDKTWEWDEVSPCWSDFATILDPWFTKIIEHLLPWSTEVSLLSLFLSPYVWEIFTWAYKVIF